MRIENFRLSDQIEINVKTSQAVVSLIEEIDNGVIHRESDAFAFLAGYTKDEPVLFNEIYNEVRKLVRAGKLEASY